MKPMLKTGLLAGATFLLFSQSAYAHINPAEHSSFTSGFYHPISGADHILVMVAVGLWAAQLGGKALWAVPLSFVGAMAAGFMLALAGVSLPFVEPVILASVVAIGLIAAMALRLPTGIAMAVVAVFAVFHGHAHGSELGMAGAAAYGFGFALATALLHAVGIAIGVGAGLVMGRPASNRLTRIGGALTTLAGLYLAFAA